MWGSHQQKNVLKNNLKYVWKNFYQVEAKYLKVSKEENYQFCVAGCSWESS